MSLAVLGDTRARGHDITYARSATCVQARNACMRGVHAHFASITLTLLLRSLIWVPAGSGGKAGPGATDQPASRAVQIGSLCAVQLFQDRTKTEQTSG